MRTLTLTLTLFIITTLSSCLDETTTIGTESGDATAVVDPVNPAPVFNPKRTICDPFQTNSQQARDRGLSGNLLHLTDDQPRYTTITDYINNAVIADVVLYLDRLFVQTRPFDRGFITVSGDEVQFEDKKLFEYFAIDVNSQLQLATNEQPGYYQLALLADDGAVIKIPDGNGGEKIIVNDDGTHPTKMACATEPIYLDHNTRIPIKVQYYQGPRYHISLVAMWRPWPDGVNDLNPVNDAYCGRSGNTFFFDSTKNPVVPKKPFYELLERNWKVLENENYQFAEQQPNPCAPIEAPLMITGFMITGGTRNSISTTWETNIPASSQLIATNVSTGAVITGSVDSTLVQGTHTATISGLSPFTLYAIKAISTTPSGQTVTSDERAFRTQR